MSNRRTRIQQAALQNVQQQQKRAFTRHKAAPKIKPPPGLETAKSRANEVSIKGRRGAPHGTQSAVFDEFGLPAHDDRYRHLGPRCRANIALAIREGIVYLGTSGTTEEMVIYGELRRRGFSHGPGGDASRFFYFQDPLGGGRNRDSGGSVVDFEVYDQGRTIALRPQNTYWHGSLGKIESDRERADRLKELGVDDVFDIWSPETLNDATLELKMNQWFGPS